jgi:hypothetical protein
MRLDMNAIFDVVPAGPSDEELELMRPLLGDGTIEFISGGETDYLHWSLFGAEIPWNNFADFLNFGDAVQISIPSPDEVTELDGSILFGSGF